MSESEKAAVLAAHTAVNRIAAEIDGNRPGPAQIADVVEQLRAAVEPLAALVADEPAAESDEAK